MEMKRLLRANWDRVLAIGLLVLGALALLLGWLGVSGTGIAAEQNPYIISGGLVGIALTIIGCTVWVSADLQDEWRRLDALEERLAPPTTTADAAPTQATEQLVAAAEPTTEPQRTRRRARAGVAE